MKYQRTHNTVEAVLFTGELTDEIVSFLKVNGWNYKYTSGKHIRIFNSCDRGYFLLLLPHNYLVLLEDGNLKAYSEYLFHSLFKEYDSPVLFPDNPNLAPLPMSDHDE